MKEDTPKENRSDHNTDVEELKDSLNAKEQPKANAKGNTQPKARKKTPPEVSGKPQGKSQPKADETPKENGEDASGKDAPEKSKASLTPKKKATKKRKQKKGKGSDTPPSSIRWTDAGFAALQAIESANPEMTRTDIFSNALKLLAGHIAYLPPIQLSHLDKETLIILAAVGTKWEKSAKKIMRDIIVAELDDEEKAKHVAALEMEIQKLRDDRLTLCRMAGIPISHDLTSNMVIAIGELMNLKKEKSQNSYQYAFDDAIQILSAFMPIKPDASPKPIRHSESPPHEENPVNPSEKNH